MAAREVSGQSLVRKESISKPLPQRSLHSAEAPASADGRSPARQDRRSSNSESTRLLWRGRSCDTRHGSARVGHPLSPRHSTTPVVYTPRSLWRIPEHRSVSASRTTIGLRPVSLCLPQARHIEVTDRVVDEISGPPAV